VFGWGTLQQQLLPPRLLSTLCSFVTSLYSQQLNEFRTERLALFPRRDMSGRAMLKGLVLAYPAKPGVSLSHQMQEARKDMTAYNY